MSFYTIKTDILIDVFVTIKFIVLLFIYYNEIKNFRTIESCLKK